MPDREKRTAVVTGGSRGIGRAICLSLAGPNTKVYFNYFSPTDPAGEKAAADETESRVADSGGVAVGISMNVVAEEEVALFFKNILAETGRIDVLVNNAGITRDKLLLRMKENEWDDVININLKGTFHCTKAAARTMVNQRQGRIINIASIAGVTGNIGQANYAASKAGIIGLTKTVAKELAQRGITVNAVAPGFIDTDMTAVLPDKVKEVILSQIPLGRPGKPEDVAEAVAFLASEKASYITGQVIHVSGGMYI